jgi:hypothetical protein
LIYFWQQKQSYIQVYFFFIPGYNIYRADYPNDRSKGESAIFIKQKFEHCEGVATLVSRSPSDKDSHKAGRTGLRSGVPLHSPLKQSTVSTIGTNYSWG